MRTIVAGQRVKGAGGIQQIQVWFRLAAAPAGRQAYYKVLNGNVQPQAPGDYANPNGADFAEVNDLQRGAFVERSFFDIIDPTSNAAAIQTRLQNLYIAAQADQTAVDNAALANWGSSYDGTTWSMKSA